MFSSDEAHKLRIFIRTGKGRLKKYGRIRAIVFHPEKPQVVGFAIKRPDLLLMVKRKDRFVALDRLEHVEGGFCANASSDSWDKEACKRMDIDYDACVIWENMPVKTTTGRELGSVSNVVFDVETGKLDHIDISASASTRLLLGSSDIAASQIRGHDAGAIVVEENVGDVEESGGAAAKAGVAWAKTKNVASDATRKAGVAINDGAYKAGEALGDVREKANKAAEEHENKKREAEKRGEYTGVDKAANLFGQQLGKASGMFRDFKNEFEKSSHDE